MTQNDFPAMQTLYLDLFSGISGDMFIGALVDLGVNPATLEKELAKLQLDGYHLHCTRAQKGSIAGTKFDVHLSTIITITIESHGTITLTNTSTDMVMGTDIITRATLKPRNTAMTINETFQKLKS